MLNILVMVSGGGTNLQAVIDGISNGSIKNTRIIGVISNNYKAYALERARNHGIPGICISPGDYPERALFEEALVEEVKRKEPDLIVLAGFLVKIPEELVRAYSERIINVHPSLIPSFCGVGCYGLKVHEKALERGVKITGATVHMVDDGMDTGRILYQKAVEVLPDDTPESLQRRVMEEAEWVILPRAISEMAKRYG